MIKPQIRFKGFEGQWQLTPISEDIELRRGLTYKPTDICKRGEGVLVLRSSNINVDTYVNNEDDVYVSEAAINIPFINEGDLLFTAANGSTRLVGKHCVVGKLLHKTVHGGFMLAGKSKNPFFSQALLSAPWYLAALPSFISGGNGALGNLKPVDLLNTKVPYPQAANERNEIGFFFKKIDEMIAEAEREVNRLEKMKQASLQKMFPRPGATAPEIRFKGFTGDWICGKLSELLEIDDNRNSQNELGREDVLSVSGEFGLVNQIKFQGRSFAGASLHNYKITHSGQVVYTKSPLKAQPFGIVKSNQYGDGLLSPLYAVYNTINNACADFIHYYFEPVARLNNYLRPLINKGAKNTILISDETALQGVIHYPRDAKEQFLIADYFLKLDSLLFTKRQKLVKLRNIKQACLDRMFVNTSDL